MAVVTELRYNAIPPRASRRWGRGRVLHEVTVHDPAGAVVWACPENYVALHLRGRAAEQVIVPVPEELLADFDVDLWRWVLTRANRAFRAGRLVAPLARRFPPASAGADYLVD